MTPAEKSCFAIAEPVDPGAMSISINSSSEEIERSGKLAELEPLERTSCATKVKEKTREKASSTRINAGLFMLFSFFNC